MLAAKYHPIYFQQNIFTKEAVPTESLSPLLIERVGLLGRGGRLQRQITNIIVFDSSKELQEFITVYLRALGAQRRPDAVGAHLLHRGRGGGHLLALRRL